MKKRLFLTICIGISNICFAEILTPKMNNNPGHKRVEDIITKIFYDELYKKTKNLKPEKEVKKAKISLNDGRRGKLIIEMMKQRNREKLALSRGLDPSKASSGKELVGQQKDQTKKYIKELRKQEELLEKKYAHLPTLQRKKMIWQEQAKMEVDSLAKKIQKNKGWKKKHSKILKKWEKDFQKYTGKVSDYKDALYSIPLILPVSEKERKKEIEVVIAKEHYVVPGAFDIKVRDQGRRPTCSAFAGLRAVEILLNQNRRKKDLSEQYFYWSSKPECQSQRCSKRGSWVGHGFDFSKSANSLNIPVEKNCPYQNKSISSNETQIPLKNECSSGKVKVKSFSYFNTLDQAIESLKNNKPIVASIKLSPNFYSTRGLVLERDLKKGKMDPHSSGHAVTFIGYMKLPKILNEGKACLITVNSWGTGWGHGGYGCLSEKWLIKHRVSNPFVSVDSVEI